jgi:DnaJ-domain-containing protein 1
MFNQLLQVLRNSQQSQNPGQFFLLIELSMGVFIAVMAWWMRPRSPESNFRVRESDLKKSRLENGKNQKKGPDLLAEARIVHRKPLGKPLGEPLQLMGIRIDGAPHEILGVSIDANPDQIQRAYRELMKRYHPDKIGLQGSRAWKDAQKIAEAINLAKQVMLDKKS